MQKRGISTVIATILIVLITVASVTILWAGVYPMINKIAFVEDPNLRLTIDGDGRYTLFDSTNGFLSVRITRGSDEAEIMALKFIIDIEGNSYVNKRYAVPGPTQSKVYYLGIGFVDHVNSIKVVPIYNINGKEVEGSYFAYRENTLDKPNELTKLFETDTITCASEDSPGLSDGLVLYYDFEQTYEAGNDQLLFDRSCRGHTGTLQGDVSITNDPERGSVIQLDGGYVNLDEKANLATQTGGSKTIAFWAKPDCKGDFESSVIFGSYLNYYVNFFDTCGSFERVSFFFENNYLNWYNTVHEGEWHHYVLTIEVDGSGVIGKLYVDSKEVDSDDDSWAGTYGTVNGNFYFGALAESQSGSADESVAFDGLIDEFRIYNDILTPEEISSLYTSSQK